MIGSCSTNRQLSNIEGYKIEKIESTNNVYVIYAVRQENKYKIITHKINTCNNKKILVGKRYNLILHSIHENAPTIAGLKLVSQNVHCFNFGNDTIDTYICIEPEKGIYDLYGCENLNGLYIVDDIRTKNK
jgi:hypothetical protein